MGVLNYLDTILVPLSVFLTLGYHAFLWHNFKNNPSLTAIGINTLKRREWLEGIKEGDDKKEMFAVQSLRNTLMGAILTATMTIIINISLAALANNTYNASTLFRVTPLLGSESAWLVVLKYGTASVFLVGSFLCSSMGIGFLIDANFLINASGSSEGFLGSRGYTEAVMERGFVMAAAGSRMLCITLPLLLWMMFGPVPVALSSLALVWCLYELDFSSSFRLKF